MPQILGRNANTYLLNDYYTFNTTARHHEAVKEGRVPIPTKCTKHQKWLFSLSWLYFCFCFLPRPLWARPGRKNSWFCECHAGSEHQYRSGSCCCWCFGKRPDVCGVSLNYWPTFFSVFTGSSLQIRSLSLLWYSLRSCKYWVNLGYSFLLKLLTLYVSENWPFEPR